MMVFLSSLPGEITRTYIDYQKSTYLFSKIYWFIKSQILILKHVYSLKKNDILYLNTFYPFIVGLFGKFLGITVVYHIHEAYPNKKIHIRIIFKIIEYSANKIFCVSNIVKIQFKSKKAKIMSNCLHPSFPKKTLDQRSKKNNPKKILMISSLKKYKGIFTFCELASSMINYDFTLVISSSSAEINKVLFKYKSIQNLRIISSQKDITPFLNCNGIMLNLTDFNEVIETFGLTILEGLSYGLPGVVPIKSGVTDLINHNINGRRIKNIKDILEIKSAIDYINENYSLLSENAFNSSQKYSFMNFKIKLIKELSNI